MIFFFFYAVYALGKRKLFLRHLLARTIFRAVCCVTAEGEKCSLAELSIMPVAYVQYNSLSIIDCPLFYA